MRLICQALNVSPNRLLFGLDDYNAERNGFAKLLKLSRTNPMLTHIFMTMALPITMSALDENEAQSLMVLITSLIRAKDEALAKQLIDVVDVMAEHLGDYDHLDGQPNKTPDQALMKKIQEELERRWGAASPQDNKKTGE